MKNPDRQASKRMVVRDRTTESTFDHNCGLDQVTIVHGGAGHRITNDGRHQHPKCFTIFMAGGGVKPGMTFGATDDYSYNITEKPVHVHDLHATLLHLLGIDHEQLTYRFQGRYYRLTDVHGQVVHEIVA